LFYALDEPWNSGSKYSHMKRALKPEEHEEIVRAIAAGDRIGATSIYLSATEGDLTEAQNFVKTLTAERRNGQSPQTPNKHG
jgi:DNA-binding GntR family transcriptional regulator